MPEVPSGGFPHSDTSGSLGICPSPELFAAYRVFRRLLVPRHPPYALSSMANRAGSAGTPPPPACIALHALADQFFYVTASAVTSDVLIKFGYLISFLYAVFKVHARHALPLPGMRQIMPGGKLKALPLPCSGDFEAEPLSHGYSPNILPASCMRPCPSKLGPGPLQPPPAALLIICVENTRFELVTSCLQGRRSPN